MKDLEIISSNDVYSELMAWTEGTDTVISLDGAYEGAVVQLTWVEAMRLHKWLGERLGQ